MTETRDLKMGGRTFAVPALPLRLTMAVYPIIRGLSGEEGLVARAQRNNGSLEVDAEEMAQVVEVAFICAQAADPELTRDTFEALPITPPELLDAFLIARYQTGAWIAPPPVQEGDDPPGEAEGVASPRTSTSTGSSPG